MKATAKIKIMNLSNGKALRRARELTKVSRQELGRRLGVSYKAIEKYENGRKDLTDGTLGQILEALKINFEQFQSIKKGKGGGLGKPKKQIFENCDRRSYKRIITKECKVLRSMRREKNITQDQASALCGYSRPTIGHIENGRIELDKGRIRHIIKSYGYSHEQFELILGEEELRDEIIDYCVSKIMSLDKQKLGLIKGMLKNLGSVPDFVSD